MYVNELICSSFANPSKITTWKTRQILVYCLNKFLLVQWLRTTFLCTLSLQGSPCEDRNLSRSNDDSDLEEPSSSGQEDLNHHSKILEWAKV